MEKNPVPGSGMFILDLFFENLVTVFGLKYFSSSMRIRIRDLVNLVSGTEKIGSGIRDPGQKHPGSATLGFSTGYFPSRLTFPCALSKEL
jgi:hypothetical protein